MERKSHFFFSMILQGNGMTKENIEDEEISVNHQGTFHW